MSGDTTRPESKAVSGPTQTVVIGETVVGQCRWGETLLIGTLVGDGPRYLVPSGDYETLEAENAALRERVEAAEADTKRLDWLSEKHENVWSTQPMGTSADLPQLIGCWHRVYVHPDENLRFAIDAAIGEAEG